MLKLSENLIQNGFVCVDLSCRIRNNKSTHANKTSKLLGVYKKNDFEFPISKISNLRFENDLYFKNYAKKFAKLVDFNKNDGMDANWNLLKSKKSVFFVHQIHNSEAM